MADTTIYPYGTNGQLPSSIGVINDLTTGGADKALSAEQGKKIGKLLNAKDSDFYNVWVGTAQELEALGGDYEDNTIYLVGTVPAIAKKFNVNFNGTHTTIPSNTPTSVKGGSAFSVVVSAVSGYAISSATGTMVGGTLNKTENQDGTVTFSTSSVTGDISITASASVDSNAPIVWEDANMETFMLSKVTHANPGYITYSEAASFNSRAFAASSGSDSYPFNDIKSVVTKFNEWQHFTSLTKMNLNGFSALTEITMPSTVVLGAGNTQISGTMLTSIVIPEGVTEFPFSAISGSSVESILFPSTLTTVPAPNSGSTLNCANLKILDFSGTGLTTISWYRPGLGGVQIIKFPPSLTSIGSSSNQIQLARNSANLAWVEIGTTSGGSSITDLHISNYSGHRYNIIIHATTPPTLSWADIGPTAFYVPDSAVETYKAANVFSAYSAKIKGLSELPSGWDTPTTSE